jgi:glycosyltransferase involved in cell wall biosynthesis
MCVERMGNADVFGGSFRIDYVAHATCSSDVDERTEGAEGRAGSSQSTEVRREGKRMHILWLKTELLHPVDKGGRIRTYELLRRLAQRHHVTYVCLDDGSDPTAAALASEYCHRLVRIPFVPADKRSLRFAGRFLSSVPSALPYAVETYRSDPMREAVRSAMADCDVIVCDFLAPSINLPSRLAAPLLLFQHNVESAIWRRRYELTRNPFLRGLFYDQWRKIERYERVLTRRCDRVLVVSEHDARVHRECYGITTLSEIPTGVDLEYFAPSCPARGRVRGEVLFLGSLDWDANQDSVRWFANQILPLLRVRVPEARFVIVGRKPPPSLVALARGLSNVELVGEVGDVRPWLERCSAFVVPLRIGSGTRLKIFEALAMGAPVVSTTIGAEGLPIEPGRDLLLADDENSFANTVATLLVDPARASALGSAGARTVRGSFGWDASVRCFEEACQQVVRRRASRAA